MRLNGKSCDDSTALPLTDRRLREISGNVTRFPEFLPRSLPIRDIMEVLLNILYRHRIRCHLSGSFVTYIAQLFNKHGSICLYVAKHHAPRLNILFQGGGSAEFIDLEGFHLELVRPDYFWDTVKYTLTYGEFSPRLNVIGIDSVPCGPESNVYFVHFVWNNIEPFPALVTPSASFPLTTILTLFRRQSTSLITGVRTTVASSERLHSLQIRLLGDRSSLHLLMHIPL